MENRFVTVRDLVKRQVLRGTKLIAGSSCADNPVTWVNIMEILDEPSSLQKGELLITTGYGLDNEEKYGGLVGQLKRRDVSGIAIQLGYYINKVPEYLCRAADAEGLPVLVIPPGLTFSAILHALLEEIQCSQRQPAADTDRLCGLLSAKIAEEKILTEDTGECRYLFLAIPASDDLGGKPAARDGESRILSYLKAQAARCGSAGLPDGPQAFLLTLPPGNSVSGVIFELTILLTFLSEQGHVNFYVGVELLESRESLPECFRSAETCCETLKQAGAKRGVCRRQNQQFFELLNSLNRQSVRGKCAELHTLLDYDRLHGTNYVYTLRMFLSQNDSPSRTAARLFIHRHTLYKRLEKIAGICGWDLNDYYTRTYLAVCLMLHDYYAL